MLYKLVYYVGTKHFIIEGDVFRKDFRPYFYIFAKEEPRLKHEKIIAIESESANEVYIFDSEKMKYVDSDLEVYKVVVENPQDVRIIRELALEQGYRIAQAAIPYSVRASLDFNQHISPTRVNIEEIAKKLVNKQFNLLIIDIEVNPRNENDLLIGVYYSNENDYRWFKTVKDFHNYLKRIVDYGIDYIVGYNIYEFDYRILHKHFIPNEHVGYRYRFCFEIDEVFIPVIDLFQFVASGFRSSFDIQSSDVYSLDDVAKDLDIITPEEVEIERRSFEILKKWVIEEVQKYNKVDLDITYRLATRVIPILEILASITGISPPAINYVAWEGASPGKLAEAIILNELRKRKIFIEDRKRIFKYDKAVVKHQFYSDTYGKVLTPLKTGIYLNVLELDFDMLYPTIYYSSGIDILTTRACSINEAKAIIELDKGRIPITWESGYTYEVVKTFYELRKVTKKIKKELGTKVPDQAAKILANAVFGVVSKVGGYGLINELVSAYIFQQSLSILHTLRALLSNRVVYGDTDSLYILLKKNEKPEEIAEKINKIVKKIVGEEFNLKIEELWDVLLLFAGQEKNYIKIKGNKVVRKGSVFHKDLPIVVDENLDNIILTFLRHGKPVETIIKEIVSKVTPEETYRLFIYKSKALIDYIREEDVEEKGLLKRVMKRVESITPLLIYCIENENLKENEQGIKRCIVDPLAEKWRIVGGFVLQDVNDKSIFYILRDLPNKVIAVRIHNVKIIRDKNREYYEISYNVVKENVSIEEVKKVAIEYTIKQPTFKLLNELQVIRLW